MNINDVSTQLLFTTVPIWVEKAEGTESGTAFFLNIPVGADTDQVLPLLVTNHHVVRGGSRAVIELVERQGDQPLPSKKVRVELPQSTLEAHVDEDLDLAAIPIGPVLNQLDGANRPVFYRSASLDLVPSEQDWNDLAAVEDVVFIGYPSGLRDETNATPLIRRGITATPVWNDFEGRPFFLIDAGVFPGSSGSPVFVLNQGSYSTAKGLVVGNRLMLLGVISQSMIRPEKGSRVFLGLGKVVNGQAVKRFLTSVADAVS